MNRTIRQTTDHFVSTLPPKEFYHIRDLEARDFPPFLIRRIHLELQGNLEESLVLPETDWADMQSDEVQKAWRQFERAARSQVYFPADYAQAIIETAVSDVLEMLIQPRKNIPNILFGGENALSASELAERTELLVVYPHFARVLSGYMNRKNKDKLSRRECRRIITQVDEKVTRNYSSSQWAQMLHPLFLLAGPHVDPSLVRLFFEDRDLDETARKFAGMNDPINRAKFEAILSADQPRNDKGSDEDVFIMSSEEEADTEEKEESKNKRKNDSLKYEEFAERQSGSRDFSILEVEDESAPAASSDRAVSDIEIGEEEDDRKPEQIEPKPDFEVQKADDKEEDRSFSLNAVFSEEAETNEWEEEEPEEENEDEDGAERPQNFEVDDDNEETKDSPIWMRFMDSEESEQPDENQGPDQQEQYKEDEYPDEPVVDLTDNVEADVNHQDLEQYLSNDKFYFVNELFDGSARAYDEALYEIAQKDAWKEASKLIHQNIFKRNMINIYSEPAVDFTDRLQTYFVDKQNRN